MVRWSWWDCALSGFTSHPPSVLWHCWLGHQTCKKSRPRKDPNCVEWNVKPCSAIINQPGDCRVLCFL